MPDSGRIQSNIPGNTRTNRDLMENIAGTVVPGKVHPPRIVTGVPAVATLACSFFGLTSVNKGDMWNGWTLTVRNGTPNSVTLNYGTKTIACIAIFGGAGTHQAIATLIDATGIWVTDTVVDGATPYLGNETSAPTAGGVSLECFPRGNKDCHRSIQNCGTNAVKVLIGDGADASASQFHKVLSACSTQDDGTGGNISFIVPDRVTVIGGDAGAVRVAVTRIEAPEA